MKNLYKIGENIYITSDEEIKEGDWCVDNRNTLNKIINVSTNGYLMFENDNSVKNTKCKKIILTTDQDLIADGIQAIDDEFLEWFVKNPSCEEVEVLYDYFQVNQNNPVLRGSTSIVKQHKIVIPKESQCTCERYNDNTCNYCENKQSKEILESAKINANKQETLEEVAKREYPHSLYENDWNALQNRKREEFVKGAKWQKNDRI